MATIDKEKTAELVTKFGANAQDTGNVRVQVALLTERIRNLTEHVKENRNDAHSTRGLVVLVAKRRRLLKYLQRTNLEGYRALIQELGLRK